MVVNKINTRGTGRNFFEGDEDSMGPRLCPGGH